MASLRILFLCTKYNSPEDGNYLTNDLAQAFARLGHQVQVVSIEWDANCAKREIYNETDLVRVLKVPASTLSLKGWAANVYKWVFSSFFALPSIRAQLKGQKFDFIFAFAPVVPVFAPLKWALGKFGARSYVYNADFFPYYHRSNGMIPDGAVFNFALSAEQAALRRFDVIGCMSAGNAKYLSRHFKLKPSQRIQVLPLWGDITQPKGVDKDAVRKDFELPPKKFIALFGGQLIPGRGIEDLLEVARIAQDSMPELLFLFVGKGGLKGLIDEHIAHGSTNVRVIAPVDRDTYLRLAASCDVGLNATAAHVVVPTFPTKTIDYVRAGLPIVASVENASDYGEFIEANGLGLAAPSGSPRMLYSKIEEILTNEALRENIKEAGPVALKRHFDVDLAAQKILRRLFD